MPRNLLILPFLMTLLVACSKPQLSSEPKRIVRLDIATSQPDSALSDIENSAFRAWLEVIGASYTKDEYAETAAVKAFQPIVMQQLPPLDSVEQVLGLALPDGYTPIGIISPYNQAVITHPDSFIFIALNHYLGAENPIYKGRFPEFERRRKTISRLPFDAVQAAISATHPDSLPHDATLLNHMLYNGALLQATLDALPPETTEANLLAMTSKEYSWCIENEANIWNTIISRQLLYNTDKQLIKRLLAPSPSSATINSNAPGQTVLFTALKITQSYMRNCGISDATQLLSTQYYYSNQSLIDSQYSPAHARK